MNHNEERFEFDESRLDIVVGGQWGSEGKGEIVAFMAKESPYDLAVRVGGPNAGHTYHTTPNGDVRVVLQSLPIATAINPGHTLGIIGAGAVFIPELLFEEIHATFIRTGKEPIVFIDRNASIITEEHMAREAQLKKAISSTGEGVGAATADTVMRVPSAVSNYSGNYLWLSQLVDKTPGAGKVLLDQPTPDTINRCLDRGMSVMIEGTQGWALGLHTSGFYPFCTSREVTPWALCSQSGTNMRKADKVRIIMVIRTYPIRVGGPSGPLPNEVSWEDLKERTGGYVNQPEITTVTKKARRIAEMDTHLLLQAIQICGPSGLAVTFLDYLWPELVGVSPNEWHRECFEWLAALQKTLGVRIEYVSMGPGDVISVKSSMLLIQELWS